MIDDRLPFIRGRRRVSLLAVLARTVDAGSFFLPIAGGNRIVE